MTTSHSTFGAIPSAVEPNELQARLINYMLDALPTKVALVTPYGSTEKSFSDLTPDQRQTLLSWWGIISTETPSTTAAATSAGAQPAKTTETASVPSGDNTPSTSLSHAGLIFDPVYDLDQLRKDDLILTTRYSPDGEIGRIIQITKDAGDLNIWVEMASTGARVWVSLSDVKGVKQ